jgi:predicted MPP superfamily phosphohydrolase
MLKVVLIILIILIVILTLLYLESIRELASIKITTYDIEAPGLTKDKKIVFLSDYHEAKQLNDKIVMAIDKVSPDLVLVGGDMLNGSNPGEMISTAGVLLNRIAEKYPVYYAFGNHEKKLELDIYGNGAMWNAFRKELSPKISFLINESIDIGDGLRIYGLDIPMDYYSRGTFPELTAEKINSLLGECDKKDYNILLGHAPDFVKGYTDWGAQLTLSGHFHGGMVRLPIIGGFVSPRIRLFPKYDYGLYLKNGRRMIVTNGLGQHSLKLRIGNIPEIVQVNLSKSKDI